jgi:hypothetical protein
MLTCTIRFTPTSLAASIRVREFRTAVSKVVDEDRYTLKAAPQFVRPLEVIRRNPNLFAKGIFSLPVR